MGEANRRGSEQERIRQAEFKELNLKKSNLLFKRK